MPTERFSLDSKLAGEALILYWWAFRELSGAKYHARMHDHSNSDEVVHFAHDSIHNPIERIQDG